MDSPVPEVYTRPMERQNERTSIRRAQASDAPGLADLAGQLGYPCEAEEVGRRIRKYEAGTEKALFVAEKDGRVVGWTSCGIADHFYTPVYAEISGLVVDATQRGAGIGARLIDCAQAWARGKGVEILRLRANAIRTEAHRFYLREGFEKKKTQIVFEKRL